MSLADLAYFALQWGHAFVSVETPAQAERGHAEISASMGPRFCKRGNISRATGIARSQIALQWGHAFVSVETVSRTVGQVYHLSSPLRPEVVRQAHILAS